MKFLCSFFLILSVLLSSKSFSKDVGPIVVLISGSASSSGQIELGRMTRVAHLSGHKHYFSGYKKILSALDIPHMECLQKVDKDTRTLLERSVECKTNLKKLIKEKNLPQKSITIIGHSMGGNIARLVGNDIFLTNYIKNILTVSTPHQGTILADYAVWEYENGESNRSEFYKLLMNVLEFTPENKPYFFELHAKRTLSSEFYHAQDVSKNPGINYYSISNYLVNPYKSLFHLTWSVIKDRMVKEGLDQSEYGLKNDGAVPVYSQIYGEHLGSVVADHGEGLCIGTFYYSIGCRNMKQVLTDFLENKVKTLGQPLASE